MLLLILTGLAWMMQIMSMMKFLINYGINVFSFINMTALMIPFIISIIIPFVIFISVIFVYNKLISENEITVMMSSGLSPYQIAKPALTFAGIITVIHLILNIWIVPYSQKQFYETQWNLRYGLAHLKIQETAFTKLTNGLVVYVEKVAGQDLSQVMLSDNRTPDSQMIIFAEKGKIVSSSHGLSIVTDNGSLQMVGTKGQTTGTFDSFDMDLNLNESNQDNSFKIRRISTKDLLTNNFDQDSEKHHQLSLTEIYTRLFNPWMNLILTLLCTIILLRSSLLRRKTSFAPIMSIVAMTVTMAGFMSVSNMISNITSLVVLGIFIFIVIIMLFGALIKK
ncbi:MAG: LptF/LptG family permease [Alphaproteobacteria bacterium]|nr:LptF/LptG family permease [Alphaproteobacteria bacterium]